jgi:hypothetical protein
LADVNANIGINFDTSNALAQLRQLQAGLSRFNQSLTQGNVAAMNAQKGLNSQLMQAINATGKFVATQKDVATSTSSFTQALEKNQLSMREYFRYTVAAATANTKTFKGMFAQEREIINRARKDRVKLLQSQYIQMQAANGDMIKVLQVIPKHLQMAGGKYTDYATRMQMAAQRQQFLNQLLKQGSTQLLNFGKNTQWAGRQLMVGLTIPLSILGSTAAKTFMEMEEAVLKFTRVYGDMTTSGDATNKAVADIQRLGKEFTKYGIAVKDTMEMAATAAAMGLQGDDLQAQVINATKLSVLGQVEQQQALETTISLQNAFGISAEQLAQKINFLNAVENQTVLSIEDLTIAIPKAGPVVKQLGGSVEDLAFFMTAMKEGGINASEGANALKSGLASMINPAKKTSQFLAELGINIKGIVDSNAGNLKGTVVGVARALDTLDPLNRARAIEQLFGKFQFARISALFQNIVKDGSQASRALDLAGASIEELAILSERELKKVEDSTGAKFKKAMENLKTQLVPVGKAFLQAVTPIVAFAGKILEKFNGLGEGTKKVIAIMIGVIGGLAPVALMTFGILANGVANLIKFFAMLRGGIAKLNGSNNVLGGGFDYLTNQQIENLAETNALHTSHSQLISTFNVEKAAVDSLAAAYGNASSQARALASNSPGLFNTVPGPAGAVSGLPKKFAQGGVVPGSGNRDTVPALLTPGEVVITKQTAKENPELVAALQNGSVMKYSRGTGKSPFSSDIIAKLFEQLGLNSQTDRLRMPVGVLEKRYSAAGNLAPKEVNHGKNAAGEMGQDPDYLQSEFGRDSMDENIRVPLERAGASAERASEVLAELESTLDEMVLAYDGTTSSWQAASDKALKAIEERTDLTNKEKEIIRQRIAPKKAEDFIIPSNPVVDVKPGRDGKPGEATMRDERTTEAYYAAEQKKRLKAKHPELSDDIDSMEFSHYPGSESMYGGRSKVESPVVNRTTVGPDGKTSKERLPLSEEQLAIIAKKRAEVEDYRIPKQEAELASVTPNVVASAEDKARAEAEGAKVGAAAAEGVRGPQGTDAGSPSRKGIKAGKEIAEGIVQGMQEGEAGVSAQSSRLGSSAVPTAAETQAKVDKMDLGNKAFYDDIDTPEMRDERQILKSQDRQRRKRGATGTVGGSSSASTSSSATVSLTGRTEAAAEQLAVSTEQAATAQSQVVQQIKDESRSRVTVKGNTINIGKAREEADRLSNEASNAEASAAKLRTEAAKWEEVAAREDGKNIYTAENARLLKKQADEAEIKAAELRIKAAEADIQATQLENGNVTPNEIVANGTVEQGDGLRRIVDDTENTAQSSEVVADQTEELAGVTQDAVNAQTENATNLSTGAQITNATTGNLNDVLQATDQTGLAQDQIADSSNNIANLNEQIEEQKRIENEELKKRNAALLASADGIIPEGSQSENKYIDPTKATPAQQAYDEVMGRDPGTNGPDDPGQIGYTRDKKGQFLFDPETGEPTTLTQSQLKKKKRGMRKEKVGKVSGKAAGALGTAAMVAGMAGAPPQVTAALGGAATVAQFAPMIAGMTGPQGVVAALAAVAAGAYLFNKHLNNMAAKAAQFAKDLSATRDGLKAIGEVSGKVGASEIMNKRRQRSQYGKYDEAVKVDDTFGKNFLGSEPGKKEKKLFQENVKQFGNDKAVSDLALKLATGVADGVLDSTQANSIAANLALELKDAKLEMQVIGQIQSLIGPDGKDLKDSPMEARINIMSKAQSRSTDLENQIAGKTGFGESSRKEVAALAALNMNNLELATMIADQVQVEYETQKKKLEAEKESTTNALQKFKLSEKIAELDAQNLKDTQFMNGMIADQINKNSISFSKVYSGSVWGKQAMREDAFFDASRSQVESTYKGTDQEDAAKKFLNKTERLSSDTTTGKYNASTGLTVKTGLGTAENAQRFQAKMEMLVGSKVLSPAEATGYMDLFSGKLNEMDFLLNASIQTRGAGKTKELFGIFAGFSAGGRKQATSIITNIVMQKKDPAEFDAIMETLKGIQVLDGNTIDFEILVKTVGLAGIEILKDQMSKVEDLKEKAKKDGKKAMDLDAVAAANPTMSAAIDALKNNEKYADKYKEFLESDIETQAEYLQKLASQFMYETTINDKSRDADIQYLAAQKAMNEAYLKGITIGTDAYTKILDKNVEALKKLSDADFAVEKLGIKSSKPVDAKIPGVGDIPGGGDKKNPLDFLEDLAMRIKNVRDGAFDATQPLKSMLAALNSKKAQKDISRIMDMFDGLQQRMLKMKVPKEFREMIMGMSAEDFKELANLKDKKAIFKFKKGKPKTKANIEGLTETGDGLMRFYREAQVGEAQLVNKETVSNIADQEKAFKMLMASGLSASDALKEVEDTAVASAIAAEVLGKSGSKEMKQYVEDLKKANSELARFELRQRMITANEEFKLLEQMPKLMTAMKGAGMSADQMAAALEDPELAKHLIEDLKDGKVDAKEIADYLNSIEAKKIIDIQVKYNAGKYGEAAQPGIDAAERLFAALESGIRNGVEGFSSDQNKIDVATIQKNNKLIAEAELKAAGFRHQIELINREIRGMERDIEMNYTRPIEEAAEQISDMERELEMNPIFGDRAIGKLNDENTKLSNDLAIMANQAEKINERYDKQAEALQKVADINDGIIAQQQSQLDLADALTQGDISAAARAMQSSRADQASRNQTGVMDALEQARTNEIEGLRGAESGLSQLQIAERQFVISQEIYKMENDPARLKIMADILALQDKIYDFEEGREAALLKIRDKEDAIYKINKEQLWPLEDSIADMQHQNDLAQRRLDIDVSNLTVLGKSRDQFEKIKAEIELSEVAAQNLTGVFGGMLAAIEAIRAKWAEVIAGIKAAQDLAAAQAVAAGIKATADADAAEVAAEEAAATAVTDPATTSKAAADAYAAALAKGHMDAAAKAAAGVSPSKLASGESGAIGAASIAAQLKDAQARLSNPSKAAIEKAERDAAAKKPTPKPTPKPSPTPKKQVDPNPGIKPGTGVYSGSTFIPAQKLVPGTGVYVGSKFVPPQYKSKGGLISGVLGNSTFARGTDTVPAMLTPGEFVMSKYAVQSYGLEKMKSINNGSSVGDSVYNYSINVNVESEANPDEIARVVMTQIRSVESQKLRGTRI